MEVMKVFSAAIDYLKEHLHTNCKMTADGYGGF